MIIGDLMPNKIILPRNVVPCKKTILTVSDLHQNRQLYQQLRQVVERVRPDIVAGVGDFLDLGPEGDDKLTVEDCARAISALPCSEFIFVRGNHENEAWWRFQDAWSQTGRPLHALHGEVFICGPLVIVGFPCSIGDDTAFAGTRNSLSGESNEWISRLLKSHGSAMRTLWLMHEPPLRNSGRKPKGDLGNAAWNDAIEQYSPLLTISGHDHFTALREKCCSFKIDRTACINPGQTRAGPLHYCVVEMEFAKITPCLPSKIKVTAFPTGETIVIGKG